MENKIIGLKIYPEFFDEVFKGYKTFEVRKNDRDFKVGDVILLKEWDPKKEEYTGRKTIRQITYITDYKQQPGYVVFSIK